MLKNLILIPALLYISIFISGCGKSDNERQNKETSSQVQENMQVVTKDESKELNKKEINKMTGQNNIKTVEIKTKGMSCTHCENSIKAEVSKLEGVKEVSADFKTNTVKVTFESDKTDIKSIENSIDEAGYKVVEVIKQ